LIDVLHYKWYNIILYGQSLGSGPSVLLASNMMTPIGGLILHSPLAFGTKVLEPNR
jgi:enterochelin esterase-like enzyme